MLQSLLGRNFLFAEDFEMILEVRIKLRLFKCSNEYKSSFTMKMVTH